MRGMTQMAGAPVGLLGKAPCQGDFLRQGVNEPAAQQLLQFLESALPPLAQAGMPELEAPVTFLFAPKGAARALLGVMASSVDAVGRRFPLAAFAALPAADLAQRFPALVPGLQPFLRAAAALVQEARTLTLEQLLAGMRALPGPGAAELQQAAVEAERVLTGARLGELLPALEADRGPEAAAYAFHTFLSALQNHRTGASLTLDCPCTSPLGPLPWLELARRGLGRTELPPGFWWQEAPRPRLLLSLGAPAAGTLLSLANPQKTFARLWPLRTSQAQALASAQGALPAAAREALARPETPLADLFRTLLSSR